MIVYALVFLSGFSALVYQVLWMRQLGLLFGNTSHAAAATLAAFFAGLAAGSWVWGKRSVKAGNALRIYSGLEAGIAVTAGIYFGILKLYFAIYPSIFQYVASAELLLLVKFSLALLLIFPPAFCMGGTIPVIGQYAIRQQSRFGTTSALLYGINTLGAALGAFLAGFYFPLWLGFTRTCFAAMGITLLVAIVAFLFSKSDQKDASKENDVAKKGDSKAGGETETREDPGRGAGSFALSAICFLSGFGVLALEVLWTRMFVQVVENSVYTFAAILVVVLLALAFGSLISSILARTHLSPLHVLSALIVLSGIVIMVTPHAFMEVTDSLSVLRAKGAWSDYALMVLGKAAMTIGPPALILGTIFPYLMKAEERHAVMPGLSLGRLAMVNTVGAIIGSLACGFWFLEAFGMWRTMQVMGLIYCVAAILLPSIWDKAGYAIKGSALVTAILLFTAFDPSALPVVKVEDNEELLESWEGSDCIVSVIERPSGRVIKINCAYDLGSTSAYVDERMQADIPLVLKPESESVFFLGMGTGITAGGALHKQFAKVKRVVTCELAPNVIVAAKKYMTDVKGFDCTTGLFTDSRSTILAEDGRHYLMATKDRFDIINADLFVPWRSGAGSLYTKEHFKSVKRRLAPGGMFVQWVPLFQFTEYEFHVIGRTMLEVFDHVTLWRGNFTVGKEVVAFVGHENGNPFPAWDIDASETKLAVLEGMNSKLLGRLNPLPSAYSILLFYAGNVSASKELFDAYPVNTDDKPLIEYMAPRTYRNAGKDKLPWFVGPRIIEFINHLQKKCPADKDPFLVNRLAADKRLPRAGAELHQAKLWSVIGDDKQCEAYWRRFLIEWLDLDPDVGVSKE